MARRPLASPAARAVGPVLASVILLNAIGLALPLTAIGLLIVRDVGFEGHPEALNLYYAIKFAPSFMVALFGMLSDSVDLRRGMSPSRQARRAPWMVLGFAGSALSLVLFALGLVRTPWQLYAAGLPGAFCAELGTTSVEGALVQQGIQAGAAVMAAAAEEGKAPASDAEGSGPLEPIIDPLPGIVPPHDPIVAAQLDPIIAGGDAVGACNRTDCREGTADAGGEGLGSGEGVRGEDEGEGEGVVLGEGGGDGEMGGGVGAGGALPAPSASRFPSSAPFSSSPIAPSSASLAIRSSIAAVDYQLRGLGSLTGYLLAAVLPPTAAIWLAVGCYAGAAGMAMWHGREGRNGGNSKERTGTDHVRNGNSHSDGNGRNSAAAAGAAERGAARERVSGETPHATPGHATCPQSLPPAPGQSASPPAPHPPALSTPSVLARRLWRRWGGLTTLGCALAVFIYQTPPTALDTFDAYLYSSALDLPPSLLAVNSGLNLGVGMVLAAAIYERIAPPPLAAFCAGAGARALAEMARLLVFLPQGQSSPGQMSQDRNSMAADNPARNTWAPNSPPLNSQTPNSPAPNNPGSIVAWVLLQGQNRFAPNSPPPLSPAQDSPTRPASRVSLPHAQDNSALRSPPDSPAPHSPPSTPAPAGPTRPTTWALLLQTILTSLGNGFGFLPIIALASAAAPHGAEAAAFALIISAQTAGVFVAAAGAGAMSVAMGVGAGGTHPSPPSPPMAPRLGTAFVLPGGLASLPPGIAPLPPGMAPLSPGIAALGRRAPPLAVTVSGAAGARSWDRLPEFILACAGSKLIALLLALPILLWLRPRLRQAQMQVLSAKGEVAAGAGGGAVVGGGGAGEEGVSRRGEGFRAPLLQGAEEGSSHPGSVEGRV